MLQCESAATPLDECDSASSLEIDGVAIPRAEAPTAAMIPALRSRSDSSTRRVFRSVGVLVGTSSRTSAVCETGSRPDQERP